LYIPAGALWGAEDIRRMADLATLKVCIQLHAINVHIINRSRNIFKDLKVTMTKHPNSLKVVGDLVQRRDEAFASGERTVLFDGDFSLCMYFVYTIMCRASAFPLPPGPE
jgi:hypothetical protein